MSRRIDLAGKRFSAWEVIEFRGANALKQPIWFCRCDCGTEREVVGQTLRNGTSVSCGCVKGQAIAVARTRHGRSRVKATGQKEDRTYGTWQAMHNRCRGGTESGRKYYVRYGITVCERWGSFENFLADMGEAPTGLSIDRYPDENGHYEPGNCRWATPRQQIENRRAYVPQEGDLTVEEILAGSVWINNGDESRRVAPRVADQLLGLGWFPGSLPEPDRQEAA